MRITLTVLALLSFSTMLTASESFYGIWKLNLAKSNLKCTEDTGVTMTITETGPNSYRNVIETVSKSGQTQRRGGGDRYLDGKEHPVPGQAGVTEIIQRIDASTHKITTKRDGKVTAEIIGAVSPDGKVQTIHRKVDGCEETTVYDKQ